MRVTVSKRDLASVISPRAWVTDSPITAFMMLFNQGNIVTFGMAFVAILRSIVQSNTTDIYTDFLEKFFGRRFHGVLQRLRTCRILLIPLFNGDASGKNGNHWGLAVLHKPSASLRAYDSIHSSLLFSNVIPHLRQLANSIRNRFNLTDQEWPTEWTQSSEVYSAQQSNSNDCGVFTVLNAFHVSNGVDRPQTIPGGHASSTYRPQLALSILESDTSSLLP